MRFTPSRSIRSGFYSSDGVRLAASGDEHIEIAKWTESDVEQPLEPEQPLPGGGEAVDMLSSVEYTASFKVSVNDAGLPYFSIYITEFVAGKDRPVGGSGDVFDGKILREFEQELDRKVSKGAKVLNRMDEREILEWSRETESKLSKKKKARNSPGSRVRSAAPLQRTRVQKTRPPLADYQETGKMPDPALMVRKSGVGTITFDTGSGSTSVEAGASFSTWELDGSLTPEEILYDFKEKKQEDDAAAKAAGDPYTTDLATVDTVKFLDGIAENREAADKAIEDGCKKWEWLAAIKFKTDEGGERWLMGGLFAE